MKHTNMKLAHLSATIILAFCSFGVYAVESQEAAPINKDQVNGRVKEAQGSVKEVTGKVLDDKGMEMDGNIQKNMGKIQAGYGDLKQDVQKGK
ncbi:MAG: CsbD family protein [Methylococcales bacterium]|nr:CsbD family protein [Methylococcales bacterium]